MYIHMQYSVAIGIPWLHSQKQFTHTYMYIHLSCLSMLLKCVYIHNYVDIGYYPRPLNVHSDYEQTDMQ